MATSSADIQALIDSKVALIAQLIATITEISSNPKPSYSIDGQSVQWGSYLESLVRSQETEVRCLKDLYELQNIIQPWQIQSRGGW